MPGVIRPYTLVDVLSTIYNQTNSLAQQISGPSAAVGIVGEADDPAVTGENAVSAVSSNLGWDQSTYNAFTWQ